MHDFGERQDKDNRDCLVVIPARMGSTRLPGKPLAMIGGLPMILHVVNRAREANIGHVVVATDSEMIRDAVTGHGCEAVMTSPDHQSGTDRVHEAVGILDAQVGFVVNLQGDLPTIGPELIRESVRPLRGGAADIATLAAPVSTEEDAANPNIVKVIGSPIGGNLLRALYFTRARAPWGDGPLYHHIGIYAYRRTVLERFVALPQSVLEKRERLEQLRALEAGMRIDVALVDNAPPGVDTERELNEARALLGHS